MEYFIAVAELLNFSKAASLLHITQPALSRKISQLESEMGCELFKRRKPNLHLTEAGVFVLEKARRIVDLRDEMVTGISSALQIPGGRLRIGYLNLSQFALLSRSMDALGNNFPNIEINLRQHTLPVLRSLLDDGQLDLIFDMCSAEEMDAECTYHRVSEGKLYAVLPASHSLAGQKDISIEELSREKYVFFNRTTAPRVFDGLIQVCLQNGFSPDIAAYGDNMESVMMLVGIGKGIALMDADAKVLESRHTQFVPIRNHKSARVWYLVSRTDRLTPGISAVCDMIEELALTPDES